MLTPGIYLAHDTNSLAHDNNCWKKSYIYHDQGVEVYGLGIYMLTLFKGSYLINKKSTKCVNLIWWEGGGGGVVEGLEREERRPALNVFFL